MSHFTLTRRHVLMGMAAAGAIPGASFAQGSEPVPGGTLKVSHSTRIATLNVLSNSGPAEYPCMDMLYSGLTRMGFDNQPQPDLATEWTANDDATEFTFSLREGVTFHDGTPFTADDVVATYETILNPDVPSAARSVLTMVESVKAVDDLTVKFTLAAPFADLPYSTAHANARILSRAALEDDISKLDTTANGTGPFKLDTYDSARMVRLVKNENYYKPGQPYLDAVEMMLFPDLAAETANFLSGETDVMLTVQQADYERIASSSGIEGQQIGAGRYVCVVMRQDQEPWNDVRVRKALGMAIDRQLMVDIILEGLGRPAYDSIVAPELEFATDKPEIAYDPEGARALLAEAGYPDGLDVTLIASDRPAIRAQAAIVMQQTAAAAGFNLEIRTMPHDTYLAEEWMQGDFYIGYWGMQPTIDATYNLLLTSDASYQDTEWKNEEFDSLIQQGRSTANPEERAEIYAQAQALELEDKPYIVPFFEDVLTASRENVHEWSVAPISRFYFVEDVWMDQA
ncbi:ABC transporter substrate-binding protein [Allosediminivita pacifica]|uniref:Peptide/nickel transport system substrate-binding protein n=1 Tax=Allosediminivita pacifica TaxID=1267769 RepID=A0A2T6ANF8_9RHOB|nr:ABC transporter substrate-binding protein [Allosediminivita pacifica]PTX45362.1 peptide/nickel transport system substrate-binding protein [Allosediminivita pacifica]GGB20651.1 ABC transporter substrate-binding protein [Allosediminivita pacifica]